MDYSAAATVVALMRDLPKTVKLTELGDLLLEAESADQLWDEIMGATLVATSDHGPGTSPQRSVVAARPGSPRSRPS